MDTDTYTVAVYKCTDCGAHHNWHEVDQDDDGGDVCKWCGHPVKYMGEEEAEWVSVAAYVVERAYGGPEEGGWYYDEGHIVPGTLRCFTKEDFHEVEEYRARLTERHPWKGYAIREYAEEVVNMFPRRIPRYC